MSHSVVVELFSSADQRGVVDVILPVQNQEFGIAITEEGAGISQALIPE
ncbi:hypothetical protein RABR111495_01770 [Rahnella bruchi]